MMCAKIGYIMAGRSYRFLCIYLHTIIIHILSVKTLNIQNACQSYPAECLSEIKCIISIELNWFWLTNIVWGCFTCTRVIPQIRVNAKVVIIDICVNRQTEHSRSTWDPWYKTYSCSRVYFLGLTTFSIWNILVCVFYLKRVLCITIYQVMIWIILTGHRERFIVIIVTLVR